MTADTGLCAQEPLDRIVINPYARAKLIAAAKRTTAEFAFLYTLDREVMDEVLNAVLNRLSQEFNRTALEFEADDFEVRIELRRYWIGVRAHDSNSQGAVAACAARAVG